MGKEEAAQPDKEALVAEDENSRSSIRRCVETELKLYLDTLDGEEPSQLYRMVIRQAETALLRMVMRECRGNQTRAAQWLGISRGNLRNKLANLEND